MIVLPIGCAGVRRSGVQERSTAMNVVDDFCHRFGSRGVRRVVALFADDAVFELRGLGVACRGREGIKSLAEYGNEVGSRLRIVEAKQAGDTVSAGLVETNSWYQLLGVQELSLMARFVVQHQRIVRVDVEPTGAGRLVLKARLAEFLLWLRREHPSDLERVLPGGNLAFGRDNARTLLLRLRQWHEPGSR